MLGVCKAYTYIPLILYQDNKYPLWKTVNRCLIRNISKTKYLMGDEVGT